MFLKVDLSELGLMEQTHKPSPQKTVLLGTPLQGSSELSQVHHRVSQLQHSSSSPSLLIFPVLASLFSPGFLYVCVFLYLTELFERQLF